MNKLDQIKEFIRDNIVLVIIALVMIFLFVVLANEQIDDKAICESFRYNPVKDLPAFCLNYYQGIR